MNSYIVLRKLFSSQLQGGSIPFFIWEGVFKLLLYIQNLPKVSSGWNTSLLQPGFPFLTGKTNNNETTEGRRVARATNFLLWYTAPSKLCSQFLKKKKKQNFLNICHTQGLAHLSIIL